jgi:hypothetical protein
MITRHLCLHPGEIRACRLMIRVNVQRRLERLSRRREIPGYRE